MYMQSSLKCTWFLALCIYYYVRIKSANYRLLLHAAVVIASHYSTIRLSACRKYIAKYERSLRQYGFTIVISLCFWLLLLLLLCKWWRISQFKHDSNAFLKREMGVARSLDTLFHGTSFRYDHECILKLLRCKIPVVFLRDVTQYRP